jgi:hypothetical protein
MAEFLVLSVGMDPRAVSAMEQSEVESWCDAAERRAKAMQGS